MSNLHVWTDKNGLICIGHRSNSWNSADLTMCAQEAEDLGRVLIAVSEAEAAKRRAEMQKP